jgi:hypothetical protein
MIKVPTTGSKLRKNIVEVPEVVNSRSGIRVLGNGPNLFCSAGMWPLLELLKQVPMPFPVGLLPLKNCSRTLC